MRQVSPEVFIVESAVAQIGPRELNLLKQAALNSPRGKARVCAHRSNEDALHEMIIVHAGHAYVRPHRHHGKSESFHIVEGRVTVVLFDEAGTVVDRIPLGPPGSGRSFFYRLSDSLYHTVLFEDAMAVFHEVTNGPFLPEEADFAAWSPLESDMAGREAFLAGLAR